MSLVVGLLGLAGVGAFFYVLKVLKKRLYAYLTLGVSLLLIAIGLNPGLVIGIGIVGVVGSIISLGVVLGRKGPTRSRSTVLKVFPAVAIGVSIIFLFIGGGTLSYRNIRGKLDKTYKAGLDAYHAQEFESAVNLLTKVQTTHRGVDTLLQRIPGEAFAYYCGAGQEALASENYDRAIECFESAAKWDRSADSLIQKVRTASYSHYCSSGEEALRKGEFEQAMASFRSALDSKPNDANALKLLADAKAKLAERLFGEARKAYGNRDYELAVQKFGVAENMGHKEASRWLEKTQNQIAAEEKKEREELERELRKAYQKIAREHFLDQGMDIKVRVHGHQSRYITLTWVLIGDVFVHNFRQSEMLQEIRQLGFQRVYFKDGFDYSQYVYWED